MTMQFGVVLNQYFRSANQPVYHELVEQALEAERLDYDLVVLGEHHLHPVGFHEQLTTLAALAALTRRVRLVTAGVIVSYYNPVFLAEALANIDIISAGRLILGTVLGYRKEELQAFGVRPEQRVGRFMEVIELVRQLWKGTPLDYDSTAFHIHGTALPVPYQIGGPPVWVGARAPSAIRRAAQKMDGWLISYNSSPGDLEQLIPVYRQACAARAADYGGHVALIREGFVADSMAQASAILQEPLMAQFRAYAEWKKGEIDEDKYSAAKFDELTGRMILGSPSECIEQIRRYEQMGIDSLLMVFQQPGVPQQETLSCMRRFAAQVMPAFARAKGLQMVQAQ